MHLIIEDCDEMWIVLFKLQRSFDGYQIMQGNSGEGNAAL